MTPFFLVKAIQKFLQQVLADSATGTPAVHQFLLPQQTTETQDEAVHPFVIVQPAEGADNKDDSIVTVKLIVGTNAEDNEGYIDAMNLVDRIRTALLKKELLDGGFLMQRPLKWELFGEQAQPEYIGLITTTWKMLPIEREVPDL